MKSFRLAMLLVAALLTAVAVHAQERRLPGQSDTAISAARFSLVIDGMEIAQFSQALGLDAALKRRGPADIVLKRGTTRSQQLRRWYDSASSGAAAARRNGSIIVYDTMGKSVARYSFTHAWPKKWERPALESGGSAVAVESITIAIERIEKD